MSVSARLCLLVAALLMAACSEPTVALDDDDVDDDDDLASDDDDAGPAGDDDDSAVVDDDDSGPLPDDDDDALDDDDAIDCDEDEVCDPGEAIDCPGCPAVSVAVEGGHTCAVREDGSTWCWGRNEFGELGPGSTAWLEDEPLLVSGLPDLAVTVAVGGQMVFGGASCAVLADTTVACWGYEQGTPQPTSIPSLAGVIDLDCTDVHCCAVLDDQTAACWGDNTWGQLGQGFDGGYTTSPAPVIDLAGVEEITVGESGSPGDIGPVNGAHSCALLDDGTAWCWGSGGNGQLGDGFAASSHSPVQVTGLGPIAQISAGGESVGGDKGHTCAALEDGTAACWGSGWAGQLGGGGTEASPTPVFVDGVERALLVAAGGIHSCALNDDRSVLCWGHNFHGQLGDGTGFNRETPVAVQGLAGALDIQAGSYNNCVLRLDGSLRCWGLGDMGQLGVGGTSSSPLPVAPIGF